MPPRLAQALVPCCLAIAITPATRAQLSEQVRAEIVASLPKFDPTPVAPAPSSPVGTPAPLSEDPLVRLPDYQVREARVSDRDPDLWLTRRAIAHKAMSDYSDSMTDLEWALNSWYIPFVTPSPQARASAAYAEKKIRNEHTRLTLIARTLTTMDSADAKRLLHDLNLSSHPGR